MEKLRIKAIINMVKAHFKIKDNDTNSLFFYDKHDKYFIFLYYWYKLKISENFVNICINHNEVDKLYDFIYNFTVDINKQRKECFKCH